MNTLSNTERELVALGAALASNCLPCLEFHVPAARRAGLSDQQIEEALGVADGVRQVPARKALAAARAALGQPGAGTEAVSPCAQAGVAAESASPCCG